jgi:hypothetical protein
MLPVRVFDLARLRVGRGTLGGPLAWEPYPWFSTVRALAATDDGGALIAGAAGLSRMAPGLERCTWRDDGEPLVDLAHGPAGTLGAGEDLCFWPRLGAPGRRCPPDQVGLYAAPCVVRWHPTQPRAAVTDELGQIVVVSLARGEPALERVVGDVPTIGGVAWDPSGRALAIAGARDQRTMAWLWTEEQGLRELPPLPVREDHGTNCAVAFAPRTGELYAFHGALLLVLDGGAWRTVLDIGDYFPSSGRALEFTASGRPIGSALEGAQIFDLDPAAVTWYRPAGLSIRASLGSPCCAVAGERLLFGTTEGLLVERDGGDRFCWGVPAPWAFRGAINLAPDASAVAIADGFDRVTVWHLTRAETPVKVRSWEAVDVEAWWHRSSAGLLIRRLGEWWRLDRGEDEQGCDDPARGVPDSEFLAPGPRSRERAGWTVTAEAPREVLGPEGECVPLTSLGLYKVHDAAFSPDGELVIVGEATLPERE